MDINRCLRASLLLLTIIINGCDGDSDSNSKSEEQSTGICSHKAIAFDQRVFLQNGYHLYLIGDTGTGDESQILSAEILEQYHLQYPLDAIVHSGDIFYPKGISSASHPYTEDRFKAIYQNLALDYIPWYLVAGNHDHDGSIDALADFAMQTPLLNYPSRYFIHSFQKSTLNWRLNLIATDTTPFTHNPNQLQQLSWLQQQLSEQRQNINIVVGHHPIFSNGKHGDTESLKAAFLDLLLFYNVPLYLSGHEHSLEILQKQRGPTYLISGAGGQTLRDVFCGKDSLFTAKKFGGFGLFVTQKSIWIIPVTEIGLQVMFKLEFSD